MIYKDFFKNKKITLLGLGILGRGVGDAKFMAECGAKLTITDLKNKDQLRKSINKLKKLKNIKYVLGKHRLSDFRNADMVIKGAGVPPDSLFIKEAISNHIPVYMSTALFAKFFVEQFEGKIIGVTGTRGKTTTTSLIYHILKKAGKNVVCGGNIQGKSTLSMIEKVKKDSIAVLELDSWQLQGFGTAKISPHISVFTNLFPDHMNYYGNNMKKYIRDKANIFLCQTKNDHLIIGKKVFFDIKTTFKNQIKSKITIADPKISEKYRAKIFGEHNKANIACAVKAAEKVGISESAISKAISSFTGVSGRLEFIGVKRGIKIFNDTTSTTPEAGIAALKSLASKKIILICGGSDKGLGMKDFVREAGTRAKKVVMLSGSGTEKTKKYFKNSKIHKTLKEAVAESFASAKKGDFILFSPAFASFGMFENEYDRGEKFVKEIKKY